MSTRLNTRLERSTALHCVRASALYGSHDGSIRGRAVGVHDVSFVRPMAARARRTLLEHAAATNDACTAATNAATTTSTLPNATAATSASNAARAATLALMAGDVDNGVYL